MMSRGDGGTDSLFNQSKLVTIRLLMLSNILIFRACVFTSVRRKASYKKVLRRFFISCNIYSFFIIYKCPCLSTIHIALSANPLKLLS